MILAVWVFRGYPVYLIYSGTERDVSSIPYVSIKTNEIKQINRFAPP